MDLHIRHIYSSAWTEDGGDARAVKGLADIVVCLSNGEQYVASFGAGRRKTSLRGRRSLSPACGIP
ncbi:MAG: hypothetical protein KDC75_19790 [Phaeodactylibacter sp.]|nr:hypothetical protein [Phaeodactylibacter sp.]